MMPESMIMDSSPPKKTSTHRALGIKKTYPPCSPLIGNGESGDGWNGFRAGEILIAPSPPGFVKQAPFVQIVTLFSFMISVSIRGYRLH